MRGRESRRICIDFCFEKSFSVRICYYIFGEIFVNRQRRFIDVFEVDFLSSVATARLYRSRGSCVGRSVLGQFCLFEVFSELGATGRMMSCIQPCSLPFSPSVRQISPSSSSSSNVFFSFIIGIMKYDFLIFAEKQGFPFLVEEVALLSHQNGILKETLKIALVIRIAELDYDSKVIFFF